MTTNTVRRFTVAEVEALDLRMAVRGIHVVYSGGKLSTGDFATDQIRSPVRFNPRRCDSGTAPDLQDPLAGRAKWAES